MADTTSMGLLERQYLGSQRISDGSPAFGVAAVAREGAKVVTTLNTRDIGRDVRLGLRSQNYHQAARLLSVPYPAVFSHPLQTIIAAADGLRSMLADRCRTYPRRWLDSAI